MSNAKHSTILLICILATASLNPAQAAVVAVQPLESTSPGEFSNLGSSNQQVADDFTLSQDTILDSISWLGRYGNASVGAPNPTDFSIRFYRDSGGTPQVSPILSLNLSATPGDFGFTFDTTIPWYSYSASLPDLELGADTYWVSIVEDDTNTALFGSTQWLWADSDTTGTRALRNNDIDTWSSSRDINHAFSLSGTVVPVPAAAWLFGTALLGMAGFAKRKRRG